MSHATNTDLPPNHHADHPGFTGLSAWATAWIFRIGRGGEADLAVTLTATGAHDDVVDVGCGAGIAAERAAAAGAASVVGIDPSPAMLKVAQRGRRSTDGRAIVRYVEGVAERLPLDDGAASVLWSLATVHHWKDLSAGLAEARRVLRPGGRFLAVERRVLPGAKSNASHGWVDEQAATFADACVVAGFGSPEIGHHRSGRQRAVISVLAHVER
jgi:SAM-dependent methyltransferase